MHAAPASHRPPASRPRRPILALALVMWAGIAHSAAAEPGPSALPELLCALRVAGHTQLVRSALTADPYAPRAADVRGRFRFKAVLLGDGVQAAHATVTVTDTEAEEGPAVLQQVSWPAAATGTGGLLTEVDAWAPRLSGWQRVYSPYLGRELTWGCALVRSGATPRGAADVDGTVPSVVAAPSPAPQASVTDAGPTVRLAWMGDVMLADGPGHVIRRGGDPFAAVASRLASADLRIANLECVIARSGKALAKPWTFRAHPRVLPVLQKHVDVVSLANNHSGDYGAEAFEEMLARLDRAGLPYVGGGRNLREAHRVRVIERKGVRIALIAYNEMFPRRFEAGDDHAGIAWSDDEQVLHDIRLARARADVVIPFMHWGQEDNEQAHARQRALARRMIEAGAAAVVGTHPHLVQDTEVIDGKPVVYSLGNFVFDGFTKPLNNTGALLWMEVNRQGVASWRMETVRIDARGVPHPVSK
ncbi:CapA family protein [Aquabacterium olei]|nr:CapA family protein [Aquabacterium olei]